MKSTLHTLAPGHYIQTHYVIYWMQQSQRIENNQALQAAIVESNQRQLPLLVVFIFMKDVPDANQRHFRFMTEGLVEVANKLRNMEIGLLFLAGDPSDLLQRVFQNALSVYTDFGYLTWQRDLRQQIASHCISAGLPFSALESDIVVPVETASSKEEYSAATLRSKICKHLYEHNPISATPKIANPFPWQDFDLYLSADKLIMTNEQDLDGEQLWNRIVQSVAMDNSVSVITNLVGGHQEAVSKLRHFTQHSLPFYSAQRSDPGKNIQSELSPYLHFGQISPQQIIDYILDYCDFDWLDVPRLILMRKTLIDSERNIADFLEELIVRRELGINFCYYNDNYDNYLSIPTWARQSLANHLFDPREFQYCLDSLEHGNTHDKYWNYAQREMLERGKMHNYMRMYWGKKIIEWSESPEDAYLTMVYLNNRYELDGRDANGYAGIAWCFGKHDRAWQERPIFGKVRYMNAEGLQRKFKMKEYIDQ